MHADLVALGYEGSYSRVATFAREWKADLHMHNQTSGRGTFVPLSFEPGEAFQFDWSEDWAIIGNERTKLQVAHTKLSYSRAFIRPMIFMEMLLRPGFGLDKGRLVSLIRPDNSIQLTAVEDIGRFVAAVLCRQGPF